MIRVTIVLILLFGIVTSHTQSSRSPKNDRENHILDRLDILYSDSVKYHSTIRNFSKKVMVESAVSLKPSVLSVKEIEDLNYILRNSNEWVDSIDRVKREKAFLRHFYKTPANLIEYNHKDFFLRLNPVFNIKVGNASNDPNFIFQNTRGFLLRGMIDNKVYFSTSLYENQQRFLFHIENRIDRDLAIPGNGFYKTYQSGIIDKVNGWDYLNAEAYVGFSLSNHISLEFGHANHFIGNGYRSLILSDYANNYFYLKFNTRFWKIHYQNIFAELSVFGSNDRSGDLLIPKKYFAAHYLDFRITDNFSFGIFEAVVFNRENNFEFQYLNPLIIYRTVEQFIGSPDNILIGLNAKWNFLRQFQIYGQLIFDEFKLDNLSEGNGWWANKYGTQLGIKYINALSVDHLDLQMEWNSARPYLYSHRGSNSVYPDRSIGSYSHYNQPLAHPLGANFNELIGILRYRLSRKINIEAKLIFAEYGDNPESENWGGNILLSSDTRIQDFDNSIGQGINTDVLQLSLNANYEIMHNLYVDLNIIHRNKSSAEEALSRSTTYFGTGFRMNIANQRLDY